MTSLSLIKGIFPALNKSILKVNYNKNQNFCNAIQMIVKVMM